MKVLHITYTDSVETGGGTSVFVGILNEELRKAGISSEILCAQKTLQGNQSRPIHPVRVADRLARTAGLKLGFTNAHQLYPFGLPGKQFSDVDLLHFHDLHSEYFNYLALPFITRRIPAVWTFHDFWALTGHCAAPYDCDRWKTGCGHCPYPETPPRMPVGDTSAREWKWKQSVYKKSNLHLVVICQWMRERTAQSMMAHLPVTLIPNGIDTDSYRPLERQACRSVLGISQKKNVILAGSVQLSEYRKGGDLLRKALEQIPLPLREQTLLATIGNGGPQIADGLGFETKHFGYLHDVTSRAIVYSAADLFVLPTRADMFPLISLEVMACGVPVVSYRVGGVPEQIRHRDTGLLAEPESVEGLESCIRELLLDHELRHKLGRTAREVVAQEYNRSKLGVRYRELYENILRGKGSDNQSV